MLDSRTSRCITWRCLSNPHGTGSRAPPATRQVGTTARRRGLTEVHQRRHRCGHGSWRSSKVDFRPNVARKVTSAAARFRISRTVTWIPSKGVRKDWPQSQPGHGGIRRRPRRRRWIAGRALAISFGRWRPTRIPHCLHRGPDRVRSAAGGKLRLHVYPRFQPTGVDHGSVGPRHDVRVHQRLSDQHHGCAQPHHCGFWLCCPCVLVFAGHFVEALLVTTALNSSAVICSATRRRGRPRSPSEGRYPCGLRARIQAPRKIARAYKPAGAAR